MENSDDFNGFTGNESRTRVVRMEHHEILLYKYVIEGRNEDFEKLMTTLVKTGLVTTTVSAKGLFDSIKSGKWNRIVAYGISATTFSVMQSQVDNASSDFYNVMKNYEMMHSLNPENSKGITQYYKRSGNHFIGSQNILSEFYDNHSGKYLGGQKSNSILGIKY